MKSFTPRKIVEWQQPVGVGTNFGGFCNKEMVAGVTLKNGQVTQSTLELYGNTSAGLLGRWLALTILKNDAKRRIYGLSSRHPTCHSPG